MHWIGLTGGLATGKSTVANILRQLGYQVIDADQLAREVVESGTDAFKKIVQTFGREILNSQDEIDRKRLGQIVFGDSKKREILESIIHPEIRLKFSKIEKDLIKQGVKFAFYDVPLLFEKSMQNQFSKIILVSATKDFQIERAMKRGQWTKERAQLVIDSQMELSKKAAMADFVIENNSNIGELKEKIKIIVNDIEKELLN